MMDLTTHVMTRCRQRGIPEYLLDIIWYLGVKETRPYSAIRSTLRKKDCDRMIHELKQLMQTVEKLKRNGVSVVASEEGGCVITTYRRT